MNRLEAMAAISAVRGDAAAVTGPGANSGLLFEQADTPATLYNMELGYATSVALGVARPAPSAGGPDSKPDGAIGRVSMAPRR